MTNSTERDWYVFAYYDASNTTVFVGMEQEVSGSNVNEKYSRCTRLDSSKGYCFSDTEQSRVLGVRVLCYGMSRDEADMSVKVARNMLTTCMPKQVGDNMLKVRFVKELNVEISTGALEDNSTLSDEDLGEVETDEVAEDSVVDNKPNVSKDQEDIRLRLEHTESLILYTLAKKESNTKLAAYYLEKSKELRSLILEIGLTPEDGLSGPSVLDKRSIEELKSSLNKVNEYQKQYNFKGVAEPVGLIDTSKFSIEEEEEEEIPVKKSVTKEKIKGAVKLSDEEFNAVVDDFTQYLAKNKQNEIDKLMGVKKPHPLDNLEFDEPATKKKQTLPKSFEVVAEDREELQDSDLGELDEQLRLKHFKLTLFQVKARRMGRNDLVDKYANKSEALRKQIISLGVSEIQDMADIAVVGRMKNSELRSAIEEVKRMELEGAVPKTDNVKTAEEVLEEKIQDLTIANNIDQEIINHQKRKGLGTAKERNELRRKIAERKKQIEDLKN